MKLDKYTVPTGNWTPDRRMAVHYVTAALRKLHTHGFNSCIVISVYPLNIPSIKKGTEYCTHWKFDILTRNQQQIVKFKWPLH